MAIWNGSSLSTNLTAESVSKWWGDNFVPAVVLNNGLLYAMKNMDGNVSSPALGRRFERNTVVSGNKLSVTLLGELDTYTGIADADQATAFTLVANTNAFGGAEFDWSHYHHEEALLSNEAHLLRGKEARGGASHYDNLLSKMMFGYEKTVGDAMAGTSNQARTTLGSWKFAVAADNTYGTIDRTDSANAFFRGYVGTLPASGAWTLDVHDEMKTELLKAHSGAYFGQIGDVAVCGTTVYNAVKRELRNYTQSPREDWKKFPAGYCSYDSTVFVLDSRLDAGDFGLLTSASWTYYENYSTDVIDKPFGYKGVNKIIVADVWNIFACKHPAVNGKTTGFTG